MKDRIEPAIARGLAALACLIALGGGGCGDKSAPDDAPVSSFRRQRGPRLMDNQETTEAQPEAARPSPVAMKPIAPAPAAAAKPEVAPEEKPERDFGADLSSAVGNVTSCVKPRPTAGGGPTTLSVSLEAVLTETGIVTRSSAHGSGLDAAETECVRKRLDGARLAGPIEGAPRTVSTTITLTLTAPPPTKPGEASTGTPSSGTPSSGTPSRGMPGSSPPATGSP